MIYVSFYRVDAESTLLCYNVHDIRSNIMLN